MIKILQKNIWSETDWTNYLNNIDMLRKSEGLKKSEFSELIGVANAWRKDRNKPSRGEILAICREFNVDEKWLFSRQPPRQWMSMFEADGDVNQHNSEYALHGDPPMFSLEELTGIPENMGMAQAVKLLMDIYESENQDVIKHALDVLQLLKIQARAKPDRDTNFKRTMQMLNNLINRIAKIERDIENIKTGVISDKK